MACSTTAERDSLLSEVRAEYSEGLRGEVACDLVVKRPIGPSLIPKIPECCLYAVSHSDHVVGLSFSFHFGNHLCLHIARLESHHIEPLATLIAQSLEQVLDECLCGTVDEVAAHDELSTNTRHDNDA